LKNDVEEMRGQKESRHAIFEAGQWRERRECDFLRRWIQFVDVETRNNPQQDKRIPSRIIKPCSS
jgi:hypothetical protein